jgi:hypothetical protein
MKPNSFALVWHKIQGLFNKIFLLMLKTRGLTIGEDANLGKMTCDWPHKLIIGYSSRIKDDVDFRIW